MNPSFQVPCIITCEHHVFILNGSHESYMFGLHVYPLWPLCKVYDHLAASIRLWVRQEISYRLMLCVGVNALCEPDISVHQTFTLHAGC